MRRFDHLPKLLPRALATPSSVVNATLPRQRPSGPRTAIAARGACVLLLLVILAAPLHAQIESGQVIDDSTGAALVGSRVLLQHDTAGAWQTIETTHTDARGLFQFRTHPAGHPVRQVAQQKFMFNVNY